LLGLRQSCILRQHVGWGGLAEVLLPFQDIQQAFSILTMRWVAATRPRSEASRNAAVTTLLAKVR
jgi:hypothetical protein